MVLSPFIFLFWPKRGQEIRGGKHFKCLPPVIYTVLKYPDALSACSRSDVQRRAAPEH